MSELIFQGFPSIKRMRRGCVITEKIDGSNGQILFDEYGSMLVGSRRREITPESEGFMKPEGIVVYHTQINQMFKLTFGHDRTGKPE